MIEVLFSLALIFFLWSVHHFYLSPFFEAKRYAKLIRSLGYTVYEAPFRPWSTTFNDDMKEDALLHKDACYR